MEFRSLGDGEKRHATAAEVERLDRLHERGVADVYDSVDMAGKDFWRSIVRATHWHLASITAERTWADWEREYFWATGLPNSYWSAPKTYERIVEQATIQVDSRHSVAVSVAQRLAAVEHLMDVVGEVSEFAQATNDKARWLRIGVAVEGRRFVALQSAHAHEEIVRPALLLLSDPGMRAVDDLFRKSFDRFFAHDHAGAITAATSAVEEYLRLLLDEEGGQLAGLLQRMRRERNLIPAVEQMAVKLGALRDQSDAHTVGTDDADVAMFAIHVSASVLLHLESKLNESR